MVYEIPGVLWPIERVGNTVCFSTRNLGLNNMLDHGDRRWMCELIDGLAKRGLRFIWIEQGSVYCELLPGAKLEADAIGYVNVPYIPPEDPPPKVSGVEDRVRAVPLEENPK